MGLPELFVAVLITGISCVNAALPAGAYGRSRDGRFLVLVSANGLLALLGALWTWGELPWSPPGWVAVSLPTLMLVLLVALLFLAATMWPRHV